jgi:hypothetical protein
MNHFISPSPNGHLNQGMLSKTVGLSSYNNDRLVSPYDGIVVPSFNRCDGNLSIEHNVNGEIFYSDFCEITRIIVGIGGAVKQGHTIGYFSDNEISFSILNKNKSKQNVNDFLSGNRFIKDVKKSETKEPKTKESNVKSNNDRIGGSDIFTDMLLSPLSFIKKALTDKPKKKKDDDLNENIIRIKQLLK